MPRPCISLVSCFVAGVLLFASQVWAQSRVAASAPTPTAVAKVDVVLAEALKETSGRPRRVIVTTTTQGYSPIAEAVSKETAAGVVHHRALNAFSAEADPALLRRLADDRRVLSISSNAIVRATAVPDVSHVRETLGVPTGSLGGAGVGVAVIDSGIHPSSSFTGRITAFYDFTEGGTAAEPSDDYGHGTHVAGIIGGIKSPQGDSYYGVAPAVRLIGLKVLGSDGTGLTSDVISALEFAVEQRAALDIHVINLSLGHPILEPAETDPLVRAVENAVRAGIVVVVSAGNFGQPPLSYGDPPQPDPRPRGLPYYTGITSPGNCPDAITVGAARSADTVDRADDRIAEYSSRGPTWFDAYAKPDIVAPGHGLVSDASPSSTLYLEYAEHRSPELPIPEYYMRLNGTSMAAAVTTGVVALILEASWTGCEPGMGCPPLNRPALTPHAIKAVLQHTTLPIADLEGAERHPLGQGAGAINADGAIQLVRAIDPSMEPGEFWLTGGYRPYSTIGDSVWSWSVAVLWGDLTDLLGLAVLFNQPAWGLGTRWGDEASLPEGTEWGDSFVWLSPGVPTIWGDDIVWAETHWGGGIVMPDNIVWGDVLRIP